MFLYGPLVLVKSLRLVGLFALAITLVSAVGAGGARPAGGAPGLIAFTRNFGHAGGLNTIGDLYVMRADGTQVRHLWRSEGGASTPAWSPDGRRLAFFTFDGGETEIRVMDVAGKRTRLVTTGANFEYVYSLSLTWSPDGRIAFVARDAGGSDVWVVNANGSNLRPPARTPDHQEAEVDWSPGGNRLAVTTGRGISAVWVTTTDGTYLRNVTPVGFEGYQPQWAPGGRRIALTSWNGAPPGDADIWVTDAAGPSRVRVTKDGIFLDRSPTWSPDGRKIAFARSSRGGRRGSAEIYLANANGTGLTRLTHNRVNEGDLAWQPAAPP